MYTLFGYIIKISACYAVVYIFYWLVLRHLTNYKSNRFYLLIASLVSFVIPLLQLDFFVDSKTITESNFINYIPSLFNNSTTNAYIPQENSFNLSFALTILFLSGVIICFSFFMMQLISFKKITANASLINEISGIKLYHLNMDIMPFSFGNAVYINKYRHAQNELDDIIKHESVHVRQHHTIDVMIAEFICILNWYNPFVWLIKHAIKQNLEFLADDVVITNGADKKSYQYLLLKVTGYSPISIASSFKLSSLKQRIYMMNKTRTSQKHLLKFLFVLPLIAVLMVAFRDDNPHAVNTNSYIKEEKFMLSELTYNIPDNNINMLVKKSQNKSLLQPGKPFNITLIKNERDRLKSLLENNGYNNINSHAIVFLIDSSLTNNSCAIQVNIDLQRKSLSLNNTKNTNNIATKNFITQFETSYNRENKILSQSITAVNKLQAGA